MSCVPTAMIFDDHDVRDDWNTSAAWRDEMRATTWWRTRIRVGARVVLGLPAPRQPLPRRARGRPGLPQGHRARRRRLAAARRDRRPGGRRDRRGQGRAVQLPLGPRAQQAAHDRLPQRPDPRGRPPPHARRLRVRLARGAGGRAGPGRPPGARHVGPLAAPARDRRPGDGQRDRRRPARPAGPDRGEPIRQVADLEHWSAFRASFDRLTDHDRARGAGAGPPRSASCPATSTTATRAEADLPGAGSTSSPAPPCTTRWTGTSSPGSG